MSSDAIPVSQELPSPVELPLVYVIITHTQGYTDDDGIDRDGTVSIYVTQKGKNGRQGPERMFKDEDQNKIKDVETLQDLITNSINRGKLGKAKVLMPTNEPNPLHVETKQDTWRAIMTANNFFRKNIIDQIYNFPVKASDSNRSGDLRTIYPLLLQGGRRTIPKSSRKYKKSKRVFRKKSRSTRRR
jgi:hypothetical protein